MGDDSGRLTREAVEGICRSQGVDPNADTTQTLRLSAASASGPHAGSGWRLPAITASDAADDADSELRLGEVLGEGGMGLVLSARQRSLNRDVAVKMLRSRALSAENLQGLRREAELVGSLDHPNILPVHAVGHCRERGPLLILKRVDGAGWDELIRDSDHGAWDAVRGDRLTRHLEILTSVCCAVEFAHSRGILHRDIKPENVMVGAFGEVYLLDWGVAIPLAEAGNLSPDALVGSPAFMAPEMASSGELTVATDVYLLGATLHEVLIGEPRHPGDSIYQALYHASLSPPFAFGSEVPDLIAAVCNKACALAPEDRFASVAELRHAVEDYLNHQGLTEVCRAAEGRLGGLESSPLVAEGEAIFETRRLFGECRFGFQQVLSEWPDHGRARAGMRRALVLMIEREVAVANHQNARQLLRELSEPIPELEASVVVLEQEAAAQQEAAERLDAMRRETRFAGADWRRSFTIACNGIGWCATLYTIGYLVRTQFGDPSPTWNLGFGVLWLVVAGGGGYLLRRSLAPNQIFRRFMELGAILPVFAIINRVATVVSDRSFHETLIVDYFLVAVCVAGVALIEPTLLITAVITGLGALWASQYPAYALEIAAPLALLVNLHIAWLVRPGRAERADGEPGDPAR